MRIKIKEEQIFTIIIITAISIFFFSLGYINYSHSSITTATCPANSIDNFAKCITNKGFVMYGRDTCHWCQYQKAEFGNSFKYINYIDCDKEPQICLSLNITGTPTWISNNQRIESMLTIGMFEELTNCSA
jgi:thioredoxin-related protein